MSNPLAAATCGRTSASGRPMAAVRAARRAPRGASLTAWRCSSVRRAASAAGRVSSASADDMADWALIVLEPIKERLLLGVGRGRRIFQELIDLIPIGKFLDAPVGVGRACL